MDNTDPSQPQPIAEVLASDGDQSSFCSSELSAFKKRKQTSNACIPCSKSKNRCDDLRPCGRCLRIGVQVILLKSDDRLAVAPATTA